MKKSNYDFIIVGSGPAGFSAAMEASKNGSKVLVVEREVEVGGACVNTGTFPSKTLREAVLYLTGLGKKKSYNFDPSKHLSVSMQRLMDRINHVRLQERKILNDQFKRNGVDLVYGHGELIDQHTVQVTDSSSKAKQFNGKFIVLATGSKPRSAECDGFKQDYILDSNSLLNIKEIPKSLTIVGAGIIGTEYATIFAALGVKVNLVDKGDRFLKFLDDEIAQVLSQNFPNTNVRYHSNVKKFDISKEKDNLVLHLDSGQKLYSESLLYALGRKAKCDDLGLKRVGIDLCKRNYISVNDLYQTVIPNIYAVGDVIGWPSLASTSFLQGRLAIRHALNIRGGHFPNVFPMAIYTIPAISYIGLTQEEAIQRKMKYVVGRSDYAELPRGQISGETSGLLKMIVHADTREILGVHIIGHVSIEVIHIAQLAILHNDKIDIFIESIFNFPTFAETLKIAALNASNEINLKY